MKRTLLMTGAVAAVLLSSAVVAADQPPAQTAGETNDQKCGRWADYQGLNNDARAEYVKDCLIDLKVPEKQADNSDD